MCAAKLSMVKMEALVKMNPPHVTFAFVDVGQGDSTVVVLPDGNTGIVVDCPASSATIDYLEAKSIDTLSHVFITHSDDDHIGGVASLLDNFSGTVDQIVYNFFDHPNSVRRGTRRNNALRQIATYLRRTGTNTQNLEVPCAWNIQGTHIEVLHPSNKDFKYHGSRADPNNASGIIRFNYMEYKILLTADVEGSGWRDVFDRNTDLQAHVLKFPHHGAWYQPTGNQPPLEEVLARINPSLAIIPVGSHNLYS